MDELSETRRIVREAIERYASDTPSRGGVEVEMVFDESQDHYELIYSGWEGQHRIHGSVLHLDIRGGKVWIQHDGTYDGIANDLVAEGIPPDRIVLAFKPPEVRPLTGFATA